MKTYDIFYEYIWLVNTFSVNSVISKSQDIQDRMAIECMKNPSKDEDDAVFVDMVSDLLYPTMEETVGEIKNAGTCIVTLYL